MTPFRWTAAQVMSLARAPFRLAPLIAPGEASRITPGIDIWDHWPVLEADGRLAEVAGGLLVLALSAPALPDPDARHAVARLRLLHRRGGAWRDLGPLLPGDLNPGSREWAGSAAIDPAHRRLTLYFTAAGVRGEPQPGFEQRLFETSGALRIEGDRMAVSGWTPPAELVRPDGVRYETDMRGGGRAGSIKAFRDPFFYRSPHGEDLLLFAASRAGSASEWNGLIGAAKRSGGRWSLLPPVIDADGVSNELERPHAITRDGLLYLFWSSQAKVFAPGLPGLTGLYGVVGDRFGGPWRPLNGDGLVFANPREAPAQAYSWQVLPDLSVWSFADMVGPDRRGHGPGEAGPRFAGAPAPALRLRLSGECAELIP